MAGLAPELGSVMASELGSVVASELGSATASTGPGLAQVLVLCRQSNPSDLENWASQGLRRRSSLAANEILIHSSRHY